MGSLLAELNNMMDVEEVSYNVAAYKNRLCILPQQNFFHIEITFQSAISQDDYSLSSRQQQPI